MKRLTKSEIQTEFKRIQHLFERYCAKYPEYDMISMLKEIMLGETIIWAGDKSFVVGSTVEYHNETTFLLEAAVGDLEEIVSALPTIEEEVKSWGFTTLEICGRRGWEKVMEPEGFELNRIVLRKSLGVTDGR